MSAQVVIAIAGMEGALCSVIGGLVDCPVIGVPTSVGYGSFLPGAVGPASCSTQLLRQRGGVVN